MDIFTYRSNKNIAVLLVEDDVILSRIYFNTFTKEGYKVLVSKSAKSAINKFLEHSINIVILDLMLPDQNGVDVLSFLKAKKPNIKVIVLTNMINSQVMRECAALGINEYLSKSDFTPEQIIPVIREVSRSDKLFAILD